MVPSAGQKYWCIFNLMLIGKKSSIKALLKLCKMPYIVVLQQGESSISQCSLKTLQLTIPQQHFLKNKEFSAWSKRNGNCQTLRQRNYTVCKGEHHLSKHGFTRTNTFSKSSDQVLKNEKN